MKKVYFPVLAIIALLIQPQAMASLDIEEESLTNIKDHLTLRPQFNDVFNEIYNTIEEDTGCRSSKFSLIHWLNKYEEVRFDFSHWSEFRKNGFAREEPDLNMGSEIDQHRMVSDALYDLFLERFSVKILEIKDYYHKS